MTENKRYAFVFVCVCMCVFGGHVCVCVCGFRSPCHSEQDEMQEVSTALTSIAGLEAMAMTLKAPGGVREIKILTACFITITVLTIITVDKHKKKNLLYKINEGISRAVMARGS